MKERFVRRYQDKGDTNSTSNLRKHAKRCWGDGVVTAADDVGNADAVRKSAPGGKMTAASITAIFERTGKGKITYSHAQHTKTEAR